MIEFDNQYVNPKHVESLHSTETKATYGGTPVTLQIVYSVHLVCTTGTELVEHYDTEAEADKRLSDLKLEIDTALNI